MKDFLSPKELAEAMGVSESSLKRWADAGKLRVTRTAGGHRRIARADAAAFLREHALAVGASSAPAEWTASLPTTGPQPTLLELLQDGDPRARSYLVSKYLAGEPAADLFDGDVREAMTAIGTLWQHSERGVFLEHRATDLCLAAVTALRALFEHPVPGRVALGGAPCGDPYLLPSAMAAALLASEHYHAVNLGPQTPCATLRHAERELRPSLLWLSLTAEPSAEVLAELRAGLPTLSTPVIVIGGQFRHSAAELRDAHAPSTSIVFVESMHELAALARQLALQTTSVAAR